MLVGWNSASMSDCPTVLQNILHTVNAYRKMTNSIDTSSFFSLIFRSVAIFQIDTIIFFTENPNIQEEFEFKTFEFLLIGILRNHHRHLYMFWQFSGARFQHVFFWNISNDQCENHGTHVRLSRRRVVKRGKRFHNFIMFYSTTN